MVDACLSESPEEEDIDSPGPLRGDYSPQTPLQGPSSPCTDDWLGSPRKRTQTLPTFNCPLTGMAAKTEALRWSRIQESVDEKSATLSEDIFKILDLRTSGSFFGGSSMSNKAEEDRLNTRRASDNQVSLTAAPRIPESDSQSAQVLSHQKSVDTLPINSPPQQVNSLPQQKKDPEQPLLERWVYQRGHMDTLTNPMSCYEWAKQISGL